MQYTHGIFTARVLMTSARLTQKSFIRLTIIVQNGDGKHEVKKRDQTLMGTTV